MKAEYLDRVREKSSWIAELYRPGLALVVLLLIVMTGTVILNSGEIRSSYVLDNTTELTYIESNKIGSVILQNPNGLPVIHHPEDLKACIYTSGNRSPLLLEVERSERVYLESGEIQSRDVNLSIPEKKLSRNGLNQEMSVTKQERCPVRATPQIILTEGGN